MLMTASNDWLLYCYRTFRRRASYSALPYGFDTRELVLALFSKQQELLSPSPLATHSPTQRGAVTLRIEQCNPVNEYSHDRTFCRIQIILRLNRSQAYPYALNFRQHGNLVFLSLQLFKIFAKLLMHFKLSVPGSFSNITLLLPINGTFSSIFHIGISLIIQLTKS